jgi:hypothetical protein
MIRPLTLSLAAGIALLTAALCDAAEIYPVVHNEPITIRILGGKDGLPLAHMHLVMLGGYDQGDLHDQLYRAEILTDAHGQARLPGQLANLPWLQVWVATKPLCQANPRKTSFSVALIRRDGVSAPNRCGTATVENAPGIFTVFVKGKGKNAVAETSVARTEAPISAPEAVVTPLPVAEAQAQKPAEAEARPPAAQTPIAAVAEALPVAPAPAPVIVAQKTALSAAPAPAVVVAKNLTSGPARSAAYRPVRQVAGRPVSRRARPVLASCPLRQPAATARSEDKPATAINAIHKAKPAAGVRLVAAAPGKRKAPAKQE